jgi:hypothetical protein
MRVAQTVVRMSVEDYTRSRNLQRGTNRRMLFTRVALLPLFKVLQLAGCGSYLVAVLEKDPH